jgi:hypothetical protein
MKTLTKLILFFLCLNLNAQKGKLYYSSWLENDIAVSNISSDKFSYFDKGKFYYLISNNNDNLILDLKIEDTGAQNRILKQGLTIWINMDGKSAKVTGLRFPIGSQYSGGRGGSAFSETNINPDGSIITPLSRANTIELTGFSGETAKRFPSDNTDNFRGSVKYDNEGILHYRMIMPIEKLPSRNSKDGDSALPFTLGIEYGALPPMNVPGSSRASGAASVPPAGGSRGGAPGGGRSGGRGAGNVGAGTGSSPSQNAVPSVLLWVKNISLATDK